MRPQADTLSLCDSDLTASFDSAAWLPVIPGSQLCWPSTAYSMATGGLQPPLTTSLGLGNGILVMHAKGRHLRETEVWRPPPHTQRSRLCLYPMDDNCAVRKCHCASKVTLL